jgi:N-acetylneuraminic acid mutarotase
MKAAAIYTNNTLMWAQHQMNDRRRAIMGAALIILTLMAPIVTWMVESQRYVVAADTVELLGKTNPALASKLSYKADTNVYRFNSDGLEEGPDKLRAQTGGGGKHDDHLYSADIPRQAGQGVTVYDNVSNLKATLTPQFATSNAKLRQGRVIYPLNDLPGQMVYSVKGNGVKEDIILRDSDKDQLEFGYNIEIPSDLDVKLLPSGGVGFYSADPSLYGNITYGSDADRERVENARKQGERNHLMFAIPAPVIKQPAGAKTTPKAHFTLDGKRLTVVASGMKSATYPLSIDPTFLITSSSDFNLGRAEDNIDFSTPDQIGRAAITGGVIDSSGWQSTSSINTCNAPTNTFTDYNFGLTAYNGFIYLVGGGDGSGTFTCYASINTNGTLGTWTAATNHFNSGRTGAGVVGYNGYIYVMGGETANGGTQFTSVEYSKIQANGDLGAWQTTSVMGTGRTYFGVTVYQGVIYAIGGATRKNNGTIVATTEYAKVKSDGTLASWTSTTSFSTARDRMGVAAYNGYVYLTGGFTGTTPQSDVQLAPINADGSLGTWVTTTSLPAARRSHGIAIERGYMYAFGGCSTTTACSGLLSTTVYAPVHADGTIGSWDTSSSLSSARLYNGGTSYNGVLYSIGGCTAEPTNNNNCSGTELSDSQYALISSITGNIAAPTTGTSTTSARVGAATLAYGGFLYQAGGCNGTSCGTYSSVVDAAAINDDGTLGTWAATTALPAATGMNAGRYGGSLVGLGGKLYYVGGVQKTTGAVDNYANNVFSVSQNSGGTLGTWATETNTFTNGRFFHASTLWNNCLYVVGGTNNTTWYSDIQYSCITNGTMGTWAATTTTSFGTARSAHAAVAYNGQLYVIAGQNSSGGLLSDVVHAAITNTGNITASFSSDSGSGLPTGSTIGLRYISAVAHNSVLYVFGGLNSSTTASSSLLFAPLTGANGSVGSWVTSGRTLGTARWGAGAAAYDGRLYVVGGCTTGAPPCSTYLATSEVITPNNGGVGMTSQTNASAWTAQSSPAVTARGDLMSVAYNGNLYAIGGCTAYTSGACTTWTNTIYVASINSDGSIGTWNTTLSLPAGRSYGGAVAYNGKLYVVGGSVSGTGQDTAVFYYTINANGTLTGLADNTINYLGTGRSAFGIAVSGGYIYVAGGVDSTSTRKADVLYTQINNDGTLSLPAGCSSANLWCTAANTFATARQDNNLVAYNSVLYVVGGYDGTNNLSDVQYSAIGSNGAPGSFGYTTRQDLGGRARAAVGANGYIYYFGTENSSTDVMYAAINANSTLGNLYRASSAGMATSNHAHGKVVFSDGFFYAIGGCTLSSGSCTSVNNNVEFAGQKASPRIAHYSKLFDTQVDTAPSQISVNGTLASGDSVIVTSLQTASSSNTTLGSPQIFNPTLPGTNYAAQALDSTGANVGIAFNYFINLTLDDSESGTFPDVSLDGTSMVVTDFTLFYHANPTRRLRHGASFTNTSCNSVALNGCILDTAP